MVAHVRGRRTRNHGESLAATFCSIRWFLHIWLSAHAQGLTQLSYLYSKHTVHNLNHCCSALMLLAQAFFQCGCRSLNILAMDSDPQLVLKLFAYAATLSPRSVTHSSGCDLLGSVRKDAEGMFIDGECMYICELLE